MKLVSDLAKAIGVVFLVAMLMIGLGNGLVGRSKGKTELNHDALNKAVMSGVNAIDGMVGKALPSRGKP